jgi:S1-C subfamily serine protease
MVAMLSPYFHRAPTRYIMRLGFLALISSLLLTVSVPAFGDQNLKGILEAIVKIRAGIPSNARTAGSLGTEREGAGAVIDSNGLILTIGYLILEAESIEVVSSDGKVLAATFIAYDDNTGFGLVRAKEPIEVTPFKLGHSAEVHVDDKLVVASFGGPDSAVLTTVVSRDEFVGYWEYLLEDAIYTVPSYPNYGGAALIGGDGSLLGIGSILTQFVMQGVGVVSSNMFVPIDYLKPILSDLISRGRSSEARKPWLGFHAEETRGRVFVIRVSPDGPAEKAGLKVGDIVLMVDKKPAEGLSDFYRKVWALGRAGVEVPLSVLQGTEIRNITIRSGDRYKYFRLRPKRKADYVQGFENTPMATDG